MRATSIAVLVAAVLSCAASAASAAEPGLGELNGHSLWMQFENGFRGLEQAALSQATRLQHALQQVMHGGKQADQAKRPQQDADEPQAAERPAGQPAAQQDDADDDSLEMGGVGDFHSHIFTDVIGDKAEAGDSSEEDDDGDSSPFGGVGPLPFPMAPFFDAFTSVWWKGPNVCVTREELDETPAAAAAAAARREDADGDASTSSQEDASSSASSASSSSSAEDHGAVHRWFDLMNPSASMFQNFHFSSCSQTLTKYECVTRSANHGVRKKLVTTYRCCHGARREFGKPGCTMVEMSSLLDTARDMGGALFAKMLTSAGLDDMVSLAGNATLFVPTDDAVRDFMDGIQDQNRVRRGLGPRPLTPVLVSDDDDDDMGLAPPPAPASDGVPLAEALGLILPVRQEVKPAPAAAAPTDDESDAEDIDEQDTTDAATTTTTTTTAATTVAVTTVAATTVAAPAVTDKAPARSENQLPDAEPEVAVGKDKGRGRGGLGRIADKEKERDPLADELVDLEDRTLVLAHRVDGLFDLHEARNDVLLNTTAGTTVRINVYAGPVGRTVTANCARVTKDRPAVGGVAHQVDRVLRPVGPERTLASLLLADPRLATMRTLVQQAGLMDVLAEASPLTAFLPTDEAFKQMDPAMRDRLLNGNACVGAFVRNLLVKHTVCTAAAALRLRAPNMDGEYLLLERMASDDGKLTLEDVELGPHDIMASNGVLHLLNKVLLPDSARPVRELLKARNLTRWYDLLEQGGVLAELDRAENVTLFVPNNDAMATPEGTLMADMARDQKLRDVLRYHVARPALETEAMRNGLLLDSGLDDRQLRVNLYSTIPFLSGAVTSATVQCARMESVNNRACGVVLHEVDRVLVPPVDTVMDMLQARDDLTVLRDIVKASTYVEFLSAAKETPPFTFLAPTNDAFEKHVDAQRLAKLKSERAAADAFVERHILPSSLCCSGVGVSSWLFTNRVSALKENLSHKIRKDAQNRVHIGDAVVQRCDAIATNGIMHVIDTPLIPSKEFLPAPQKNNRRRTSNLEILLFGV